MATKIFVNLAVKELKIKFLFGHSQSTLIFNPLNLSTCHFKDI